MTDALLHVEGLTMRFGGLIAVDDLSFAVPHGLIVEARFPLLTEEQSHDN